MRKQSSAFWGSPWTYFGATFLWTWGLAGVLIFTEAKSIPTLAVALIVLAMIGPGITGVLFTHLTRTEEDIRDYWNRVVDVRRLALGWVAVVVLLPFSLQFFAGAIDYLSGGVGLGWGEAAPAFLQDPAGQILSLFVLTLIPFFEELGWRGYAQDALERSRSPLGASLVLGCVWSIWHLPASFIPGTYQAGLGIGTVEFWLHFLGIVVLSVLVSWIYVNTNRSILIMVVFHAMVNLSGELIQLSEMGEIIFTLCWVSAALAVIFAFGRSLRADEGLGSGPVRGRVAILLFLAAGIPAGSVAAQPSILEGGGSSRYSRRNWRCCSGSMVFRE